MTAESIIEEVINYLKDDKYICALMIDGEWGCGKTYFVKNELIHVIEKEKLNRKEIRYISLYGCKNIEEIEEKIAWSITDIAKNKIKSNKLINNILGSTQKNVYMNNVATSATKIGYYALKKYLPIEKIYNVTSDWLNFENFIFVFDDLERVNCSISEVFAFMNELIEQENAKVIIVANEKEIIREKKEKNIELQYQVVINNSSLEGYTNKYQSKDHKAFTKDELETERKKIFQSKVENEDYLCFREKLIGLTLKYEPNIEEIIEHVINDNSKNLSLNETEMKILKKCIKSFKSKLNNYEHNNIRTVYFYLHKLNIVMKKYSSLDKQDENYNSIIETVIKELFEFCIRFKSNKTVIGEQFEIKKFKSLYDYVETNNFVEDKFISEINDYKENLKKEPNVDDPYSLLKMTYLLKEQNWYESQLEKLINNINNGLYGEILYVEILILIQRYVSVGFDKQYLVRAKDSMINRINNGDCNCSISEDLWFLDDLGQKQQLLTIIKELNEGIEKNNKESLRKRIPEILKGEHWIKSLNLLLDNNNDKDKPVFIYGNINEWISALKLASVEELHQFRCFLGKRYMDGRKNETYSVDSERLKEIKRELSNIEEKDVIKKYYYETLLTTDIMKIINRYES